MVCSAFYLTYSTGDPARGDVLDGRFLILELISQGRWSSIFKAIDASTGRPVVVKIPPRHLGNGPYLREAQIGRLLDHPGILRFLPIDERAKSRPYLVTEYLEGHTLHDELQRVGSLPAADALKLGVRICDALDYLHRRHIIHGDVKPGNIMLCSDGSLRIIDFGIARWAANGLMSSSSFSAYVGTPEYMAPEQVKGKRGDARTDLYALGAVLYEMVTRRRPFDTEHEDHRLRARLVGDPAAPSRYAPSLSPQVEEIILRALARKPADRYASAAAMKAALEAPERVTLSGRAMRLQAPVLAKLWWPVVGLVGLSVLVPVVLFFVFLALLKK
jgi:serine/threonine protein kinase